MLTRAVKWQCLSRLLSTKDRYKMKKKQPAPAEDSQPLTRERLATMTYEERAAYIRQLEEEVISRLLSSSEVVYFAQN